MQKPTKGPHTPIRTKRGERKRPCNIRFLPFSTGTLELENRAEVVMSSAFEILGVFLDPPGAFSSAAPIAPEQHRARPSKRPWGR